MKAKIFKQTISARYSRTRNRYMKNKTAKNHQVGRRKKRQPKEKQKKIINPYIPPVPVLPDDYPVDPCHQYCQSPLDQQYPPLPASDQAFMHLPDPTVLHGPNDHVHLPVYYDYGHLAPTPHYNVQEWPYHHQNNKPGNCPERELYTIPAFNQAFMHLPGHLAPAVHHWPNEHEYQYCQSPLEQQYPPLPASDQAFMHLPGHLAPAVQHGPNDHVHLTVYYNYGHLAPTPHYNEQERPYHHQNDESGNCPERELYTKKIEFANSNSDATLTAVLMPTPH